ncbi:hypothetical protein KKE60_07675 [Patescibacteria group bacterium]|nr:hypothetical protein [Patescibacteria group bacterium]
MEDLIPKSKIESLDILTAKKLRDQLSKRISKIRTTDTLQITTFISAEKINALEQAIQWAYENKLLKKKTRYAFLKFAVENTIKLILTERNRQETIRLQQEALKSQIEPNIPQNNQAHNMYQQ